MMEKDYFSQWLGIERLEEREGFCKLRMTVRKEMCNGFEIAHGGISFSAYRQIFAKLPGYQVSFTKNGRQALDHVANNGMPDVVVLDINMPVMDGLEFLEHFRGDRKSAPARVVIVTTEGREDDFKRGLEAGASAYLKKPFTPDALIDVLQGLLANPIRAGATT